MCGTRNETISHTVIECGKLAQKEYKRRHDSVRSYVHWQFCEKLGVVEKENFKILQDFTMQCDHMIEAKRPDIVIADKVKKETMIKDVAIPGDKRVCDK